MVYTARRWDRGSELCNARAYEEIVDTGNDELVEDTWWTSVEQTDAEGAAKSDPCIVDVQRKA